MKVLSHDEINQVSGGFLPEITAAGVAEASVAIIGFVLGRGLYTAWVFPSLFDDKGVAEACGIIGALAANTLWHWRQQLVLSNEYLKSAHAQNT